MLNGDTAGWVCPTCWCAELSPSTRRSCKQGEDSKGVSGGKGVGEVKQKGMSRMGDHEWVVRWT